MADRKEDIEKLSAESAANFLKSKYNANGGNSNTPMPWQQQQQQNGVTQKSLGGITPSYYATPSTANNYQNNRPTYTQSQSVTDAWNAVNQQQANAPAAYVSQYGDQIQTLLNQALNRPAFSYDASSDPLYQQYQESYTRQGQQASKDSMAQAAALTGGYGNSYAQSVGQQTYQQYLSKLNDVLPELRSQAYQQYQDEGTTLNNNIGLLQNQEDSFYNKYRDSVSDYNTELNFLYNAANDMSEQEYNHYQNDVSAWESDRAYWYQKAQDDYAKQLAAAASKSRGRGSGGKGSKSTTYALPTTYSEYVALTNDNTIMTETEWQRHKNSNSSGVAGTNSYADYLKAMIAKHN